jgi:hypothetical protein
LIVCIDVDSQLESNMRILRSPNVSCSDRIYKFFFTNICYPNYNYFGILLPLIISLQYQKKIQSSPKDNKRERFIMYKKFTEPYRKNREFYGIFLIFLKVSTILLKEYSLSFTVTDSNLSFSVDFNRFFSVLLLFFYLIKTL